MKASISKVRRGRPSTKLYRLRVSFDSTFGNLTLKQFTSRILMFRDDYYHVLTEDNGLEGLEMKINISRVMTVYNGLAEDSIAYFCREIICLPYQVKEANSLLQTAVEEEILLRKKHLRTMVNLWENRFLNKVVEEGT
jgi:hypothetical protein